VFCRRGLVSADLTVSETSPQVEVEERRSLASECRSRQLHGAGRVLVRGRMGRSRLLRAAVRGRVRGPRRVRGAGPVQVLRRLEWHQLHCARGSHAPLRSRLRDSGATATAGAARSARRLSPRPSARATAGARAPERVGWEVVACEQPTCHPVCEHGTCTRHGERASCACFEGWQGVRCDEPSLPIELSSAWSVHGARMCLLEPVHVFLYSCIMTCITIYHVVS
jgi:hypothetical protein